MSESAFTTHFSTLPLHVEHGGSHIYFKSGTTAVQFSDQSLSAVGKEAKKILTLNADLGVGMEMNQ